MKKIQLDAPENNIKQLLEDRFFRDRHIAIIISLPPVAYDNSKFTN